MKLLLIIFGTIILLCGCNGPYNVSGYNADGYNWLGFDENGYNEQGYDSSGYNRLGLNKHNQTYAQQKEKTRQFWRNLASGLRAQQNTYDRQRERALREAQIHYYSRPYKLNGVLYLPPPR